MMPPFLRLVALLGMLVSACGGAVVSIPGSDADDVPLRSDILLPDSVIQRADASVAPPDPTTIECASDARCGPGRSCCLYNGHCYDAAAEPGLCPQAPVDPHVTQPCYSNAQCAPSEFCMASRGGACLAPGQCTQRSNCGGCSGTPCEICGCDGVTYPNIQTACLAGVSVGAPGPCRVGVDSHGDAAAGALRIGCGSNTDCPESMVCCLITASCVDPTCAACCLFPPPGSRISCRSNDDCMPEGEYCGGSGCGTPGGCVRSGYGGNCTGVLAAVCGCDGRSYANECWATAARTRVAHAGMCP